MKKIVYTEAQIEQIRAALDAIKISGIQNAIQIAYIAQVLREGKPEEQEESE